MQNDQSKNGQPVSVGSTGGSTKTIVLTNGLRWRKPALDPIEALLDAVNGKDSWILQQAWQTLETGEVEWRDVPKHTESNNQISNSVANKTK